MNPSDNPIGIAPPQPSNPEDDPKLQAIEALEARMEDLEAHPIVPAKPAPVPAPTPVPVIVIQAPVIAPIPAPIPVAVPTPAPVEPKPAPIAPEPELVIPEKPATPQTMSAKMAAELANGGPTKGRFQFFLRQKISAKPLIAGIAVIIVIVIGVVIYIAMHPQG